MRQKMKQMVESKGFNRGLTVLIILNALFIILQISIENSLTSKILVLLDNLFLALYIMEMVFKMISYGVGAYFKRGWNIFDFILIIMGVIPLFHFWRMIEGGVKIVNIIRALRIMRLAKLVDRVPHLKFIVIAVGKSLPGVMWTVLLMMINYMIFATFGTCMFGDSFPVWFGTVGKSLYTLFQIMTLESWSMGIARPVIEVYGWAYWYFVPFVMVTAFILLNVVVGIVVNVMGSMQDEAKDMLEEQERKQRSLREWRESGLTEMESLTREFSLLQTQMERVQDAIERLQDAEGPRLQTREREDAGRPKPQPEEQKRGEGAL